MSDRIEQQLTLWEYISPFYEIKEPVILCEFFSGIGAQRKGIELCGIKIDEEKSFTCEWAVPSIIGYNAIHFQDKSDYSVGKSKKELIARINGVSTNYNEPLTLDQLNKKTLEWLKNVYNNVVATKDLINIMNVKGHDLGDLPSSQTSILTYSFPCQDLSLAGKGKGLDKSQKDGGTRSGLLWEVERILIERERENSTLPSILLMENVPELISQNHIKNFKKWENRLRQFGYSNYVEVLNAKNYGIPQNRKRVFMISILGDYAYNFPHKIKLKYRLKDLLEKQVDDKYYLDEETINRISQWKSQQQPLENAIDIERERERVSPTLTARGAGEEHSGMVLIKDNFPNKVNVVGNYGNGHHAKDIVDSGGLSSTITTGNHNLGQTILIKNATKQGFLEASDGDGIDISGRMETHRGTVQKDLAQTLTTQGGENVGVVIKNE